MSLLVGITSLTSSIIGLKFYSKLSANEKKSEEESRRYLWGMLIASTVLTLITIMISLKSS